MAKSYEIVKNLGSFFGITQSHSVDWRSKAERQIKTGRFGLSLKRSVSRHDHEQDKFVHSAQKMLSRISASQTIEELQEDLIQVNQTASDIQKSSQNSTLGDPVAGSSQDLHDQPLTLTTPKHSQLLGKQWNNNKLYTSCEENEIDSGYETRNKSKTKVISETEKTDTGLEKSARSLGHLLQSNVTEIEQQNDRTAFSCSNVSYKSMADERQEETASDIQKSSQNSTLDDPVAGSSQDLHDQPLTLTTLKHSQLLGKQWICNKSYIDSEETDIESGYETRNKSKTKIISETEKTDTGLEKSTRSLDHLLQSNVTEIEQQNDRTSFSCSNVCYKSVADERPEETASDIQKSSQNSTLGDPEDGSSQDLHDQPLTLTTPKHSQLLGKQWICNKSYIDSEETDIESGYETRNKSKTKVISETEKIDTGLVKSARSLDHLLQSNVTEIEQQNDRTSFSCSNVCYKSVADERPEETASDIQKSSQNSTLDDPVDGSSQDLHNQPLTLTTPKHSQLLGKQWIYNKSYIDSEETDIESGYETRNKSKTKVISETEKTDTGLEKSARSLGHLLQSNVTEIEQQNDRTAFSCSNVFNKLVADERPEEVKNSVPNLEKPNMEKPKLVFFDELVNKPLYRTGFSDWEVHKVTKLSFALEKLNSSIETGSVDVEKREEYTMLKEKQEKSTSSPEILKNEVKGCAELQFEETAISDGSNSEKSHKDVEVLEEISNNTGTRSESVDTAEVDDEKEKTYEEKLKPDDVVYGKDALKHYKFFLQIEKKVEKKRLRTEVKERLLEYDWKLAAIDEMILLAKDYYVNPKSRNASEWKELKRQVKKSSSHKLGHTDIRRKLATLPDYRPFFTYFIMFAQLLSFIVICAKSGLTYIGLEPRLTLESGIQTFMGMETVHKWMAPNVWIGPSERHLIGVGAVFAACMRDDIQLQLEQSRQNYSTESQLGCCEVTSRNVAGTTTLSECKELTEGVGSWRGDVTCNQRPANEAGVRYNMKPCCLGVKGQCRLLSHKHCVFLGGMFYQFGPEHCTQVMCLENICKPGNMAASNTIPWQPESPSQWWRVPLSLLYHHGIIELVFVLAAQWILLSQIELVAGWLRILFIYILSGTFSLLTSAIFLPYQSHVGAVGAVCGMVGVVLVELVHFWRLVHQPFLELAKLLFAIILMLFLGTLPYLDTFGMLTGFIVGALSGIIFLPYITFGKWHLHARIILVPVASIVLFAICYFLLQMFVTVQSVESCESCKVLNCVPYTDKMCDTALWQQF